MFAILHIIHALAVLAGLVGLLFLLVWAMKTLTPAQLKLWGMRLFIGGLIVGAVSVFAFQAFHGGTWKMKIRSGQILHDGMMRHDAMSMSMDDMSAMLQGKTGDEFDRAFLEGMIPHHRGATQMAEMALQNAKHEELKAMARAIIESQQREIDQMRQWQASWGY
jgi:hypothetical protein